VKLALSKLLVAALCVGLQV